MDFRFLAGPKDQKTLMFEGQKTTKRLDLKNIFEGSKN